ncbi:O-antigen ligase family protein [soil metagenome]
MTPQLALFATIGLVFFLFRRDFRERPNVTPALWLPIIWLLISASRPVSAWLRLVGLPVGGASSLEEGSPVDAFVYFTLLVFGVSVLVKRQVRWSEIVRDNGWLVVFLAYCFLAVLWSDFPVVAFKRWIKILGHPIMALIVFTEPNLEQALITLIKRCAYLLVPFSVLFIKYYPEWGREFDPWTGQGTFTGVTTGKNSLGRLCLVLGFFLSWNVLQVWRSERTPARRRELLLNLVFLAVIAWLLRRANSATSLLTLVAGVGIMLLTGLRLVNKRLMGTYVITAVVTLAVAELAFGILGHIVESTGHSATLSGREELWGELLKIDTSPIFGTGFESFWLGPRLQALQANYWWHPNEAHNGYLEIYLSLGLVGLAILAALMIDTFRKIRWELLRNLRFGQARIGLFTAILLYNWTEAAFKAVSLIWFVFYLIALDYRGAGEEPYNQFSKNTESGQEGKLAYQEA